MMHDGDIWVKCPHCRQNSVLRAHRFDWKFPTKDDMRRGTNGEYGSNCRHCFEWVAVKTTDEQGAEWVMNHAA